MTKFLFWAALATFGLLGACSAPPESGIFGSTRGSGGDDIKVALKGSPASSSRAVSSSESVSSGSAGGEGETGAGGAPASASASTGGAGPGAGTAASVTASSSASASASSSEASSATAATAVATAASSAEASSSEASSSTGGSPGCVVGYPGFSCSKAGDVLYDCPIGDAPQGKVGCVDSGNGLPAGWHFWCCAD